MSHVTIYSHNIYTPRQNPSTPSLWLRRCTAGVPQVELAFPISDAFPVLVGPSGDSRSAVISRMHEPRSSWLHDIAFQHKMELMVFGPRLRSAKWRKIGNREVDPSYWSTIVNRVKKLLGLRSLNFHSNSPAQSKGGPRQIQLRSFISRRLNQRL